MFFNQQRGVTLIEVIVAISLIAIIVIVVGLSVTTYVTAREQLLNDLKAMYLAEEGYEIIRALRDEDWNIIDSFVVGNVNYLKISPSDIDVGGGPELIDGQFSRSFVVQPVARNANDDIVSSTTPGSVIDTGAREIHVSVSGPSGISTFTTILTNIKAI